MSKKNYFFEKPDKLEEAKPIILSSPHSGVEIPEPILENLVVEQLQDTDWFIHQLYGFAPEKGMGLLHARWHRYVIDLNRSIDGKPLYTDERIESKLVPVSSFSQQTLYSKNDFPTEMDIQHRIQNYYLPYHTRLDTELQKLANNFNQILLFECHSIKRNVPSLSANPIPDFVFGNGDGRTCPDHWVDKAIEVFASFGLSAIKNTPFKGGHITRSKFDLGLGVYTLQLEMVQDMYMDEILIEWCIKKSAIVQQALQAMFDELAYLILQES